MNRRELERHVLGSLVWSFDDHPDRILRLSPEYFSSDKARATYEALVEMLGSGSKFEVVSLAEKLDGKIQHPGVWVSRVVERSNFPGDCDEYIDRLIERGKRDEYKNKVKAHLERVRSRASSESLREDLLGLAEFDLSARPISYEEAYDVAVEKVQEDQLCGTSTIDCGIPELEPYYPASDYLTIIAARPSVGKTMVAIALAEHHAKIGMEPLFYSLEMSGVSIIRRRAAMRCGVEISKLRRPGALSTDELGRIVGAINSMKDTKLWMHAGGMGDKDLLASIRKEKRANKRVKSVFVDHLGLVRFSSRGERREEIGRLTSRLATLAKELQIGVFLLCQLNRPSEGRSTLSLDRLAESGKIEQDADMVWMLERNGDGNMSVCIAKNRDGPIGSVVVECDIKTGRIGGQNEKNTEARREAKA